MWDTMRYHSLTGLVLRTNRDINFSLYAYLNGILCGNNKREEGEYSRPGFELFQQNMYRQEPGEETL